ncbi:MAG: COR domain-containing protein [Xenococcus sp. (in: cyanobacteria)]
MSENNIPNRFVQRIREAREKQLETLDLSTEIPENKLLNLFNNLFSDRAKPLTKIPKEVFKLKKITTLDLSGNKINELPECISNLSNLKQLYLSENQLTSLPESIGNLSNLSKLKLSENQLTRLPKSIGNFSNLRRLYLSRNQLTSLPESIGNLSNLKQLELSENQLASLPESIGNLSNLSWLNLSRNQLKNLPKAIGNLFNLSRLYLSGNQLTSLPKSIGNLSNLRWLNLWENQLISLPKSIGNLSNLSQLKLSGNPLKTPPIEIAERGVEAIKEYFRQLDEQGEDYIYEAKLLIIGEAGAGKTTMAKKIQNSQYKLQENQLSTEGIDIIKWSFPLDNKREFKVNIWDFGGQEIYHATHQFFLTKRSLYTLIDDSRKEDIDFYYWLNVVELLSDHSPVLIIKNEKQDRQRDINERALREQFTNLKETLVTNLKTNRGLEEIITKIQHYIKNLPHIGETLPKTWIKVRQALENDPRNYISLQDYLNICQDNGFTQDKDKFQLSRYFHDLGVCLHFQDEEDSLLYKTVILKPEWGTDAVYKVLDNKQVINNQGCFTRNDLKKIWQEEKYANMRGELLELMRKFQLCYEIPHNKDTFIAPQLLSNNQPEYEWDESNNLILRYAYPDFMPKGIISRFIVVMHQYIDQQKCVWKSGVILNKDNTKAEVIENYGKREIIIRVTGSDKRGFVAIITHELDKINDLYKRLKYQKLIPCNCSVCKDKQNPYAYEFNKLLERFSNGKLTIECGNPPYHEVQVLGLIDNVINIRKLFSQDNHNSNKPIHVEGDIQQLAFYLLEKGNISGDVIGKNSNIRIGEGNYYEQKGKNNTMSNINQSHSGSGDNVAGDKNTTNIHNSQNLSQVASDIKELLSQPSVDYPNLTLTEQMNLSAKVVEKIKNNPSLKQRVTNALKEAGAEALESAIAHPAAKVIVAGVKGYIDA